MILISHASVINKLKWISWLKKSPLSVYAKEIAVHLIFTLSESSSHLKSLSLSMKLIRIVSAMYAVKSLIQTLFLLSSRLWYLLKIKLNLRSNSKRKNPKMEMHRCQNQMSNSKTLKNYKTLGQKLNSSNRTSRFRKS